MIEIWKDIIGYENEYQVSNLGNVRSIPRKRKNKQGEVTKRGVVLKRMKDRIGYEHVVLLKSGKRRYSLVHRLVAEAFLPKIDGMNEINHKDEDKTNNCVDNLEWCSRIYNMNYGTRPNVHSKPVIRQTMEGAYIDEFLSANEAERETGVSRGNISSCCNGRTKSAGGFKWVYK